MPFGIWDPKSSRDGSNNETATTLNGTELLLDEGRVNVGAGTVAETHLLKRVVYKVKDMRNINKSRGEGRQGREKEGSHSTMDILTIALGRGDDSRAAAIRRP